MKKSGILLVFAVAAGLLFSATSCKLPSVKRLEEENARLQEDIVKSDSVQIQFMNAYAEIEANLTEIKLREKMINDNNLDAEDNPDIQQKIINDIVEIGKLMETNRHKLQDMEKLRKQLASVRTANKKLKEENATLKESVQVRDVAPQTNAEDQQKIAEMSKENTLLKQRIASLEETVTNLKRKLDKSEAEVESLMEDLAQQRAENDRLKKVIDSLKANEKLYLAQLDEKDGQISALNTQLANASAVYYFVGPAKEVKAKNLKGKNGVNSEADIKNFIRVDDMADLRTIETHSGKITVISNHPLKSYEIDTKDKKNFKIIIKNQKAFWGTSRVCLIETK